MKSILTKGIICVKDNLNIEYRVCVIEYLLNEDETFEYRFYPNYDIIDLLDSSVFQGIPGLNLDIKKEVYIRKNILPVFISERVPSKNREDYYELLEKVDMTYMDPIEYLIKTKDRYSGDCLYLINYEKPKKVVIDEIKGKANAFGISKMIPQEIASNNEVYLDKNNKINNKSVFKTIHYLYRMQYKVLKDKQKQGIALAKKSGHYVGRKPVLVEAIRFFDVFERVKRKEITNKKAAELLGVSINKYYRLKKELQNQNDTLLQLKI